MAFEKLATFKALYHFNNLSELDQKTYRDSLLHLFKCYFIFSALRSPS